MADIPERIYANDANHWHPFPGEEGTVEYIRADIYAKELTALAIESKDRELALTKLEAEVIALRAALAMSDQPCVYCSLPASEMNRCELGFPGCDRADDALGCPHLGASLRVQFLEKALEQAVSATALSILTPGEYEDDYGRVHDLPEGLTCAHLHLRGIDEYSEITKYLQEKNEE